jgi:hypothetical protein
MVTVNWLLLEPTVAVMVTPVFFVTNVVGIENVPEVLPAAIVIEDGTDAIAELDEVSVTTSPPAGAALERATFPKGAGVVPPKNPDAEKVNVTDVCAVNVKTLLLVVPFAPAVIVTDISAATVVVVIVKPAVVAPAGTVTEAGGTALVLVEVNATVAPPAGAGVEIVTVPVTEVPPTTVVALRLRPVTLTPVTDSVAL